MKKIIGTFFFVFLSISQALLAMEYGYGPLFFSKKDSNLPAWYIINDTGYDLYLRMRFGKKDTTGIAKEHLSTYKKADMVNHETCKFPKQSYFMLYLTLHRKFPIRIRIFDPEAALVEDIDKEGKALETCKKNMSASCFATCVENKKELKEYYFPVFHLIRKKTLLRAPLDAKKYAEKEVADEQSIKKILTGLTCLGAYTLQEYGK
jgi:hypothetical protein